MRIIDKGGIRGQVTLRIINDGREEVREFPNLVVATGKEYITSRMLSGSTVVISEMGVGTDNTAPDIADVALGSEFGDGRVTLDSAVQATTTTTNDSITFTATYAAGVATGAWTELGLFNTGDEMLARSVFDVVNKGAGTSIEVNWTLIII